MPSEVKVHSLSDIYSRKVSLYHTEEGTVEWRHLIFWSRSQRMFSVYNAKPERSRRVAVDHFPPPWIKLLCEMMLRVYIIVDLHLSGLNGTASHQHVQKIWIIGFFFFLKIGYIGGLKFGCCYLQYVPASKPFDHALFEVLEAITLYCTWSDTR